MLLLPRVKTLIVHESENVFAQGKMVIINSSACDEKKENTNRMQVKKVNRFNESKTAFLRSYGSYLHE